MIIIKYINLYYLTTVEYFQERNDLRELIDSFEKDATVVGNMEDTKIDILDKAINGYKTRMTQIEADPSLFIPTDNDKRWIEEKHLLLKEKEELINKCKQLEDKCTNLSDQMEHRSLKGDFNLRETKVIHFKYVMVKNCLNLIQLLIFCFKCCLKNESCFSRVYSA